MPRNPVKLAIAVLALAFFAGPIALRAAGVKAHCCYENRPFASSPKLSDGWDAFDETTVFFTDRMPLRKQAIRANTWIAQNVWSTTPKYGTQSGNDRALPFAGNAAQNAVKVGTTPQAGTTPAPAPPPTANLVVQGTHGWYFLQQVFDVACHQYLPLPDALTRWIDLLDAIRTSGRRVVLLIPPDKSTIYPEFVSSSTPNLGCSRAGETYQWRLFSSARARTAGIIPLLPVLQKQKAQTRKGTYLYMPLDSHWNSLGAMSLVQTAVPAIDPSIHVLDSEVTVKSDATTYTGDLTKLLGAPQDGRTASAEVHRAAGAPVIPGPALFVGDSYSAFAAETLAPYFANLTYLPWQPRAPAEPNPENIIKAMNAAQTVVLESAERNFDYVTQPGSYISARLVRLARTQLTKVTP